ARPGVINRTNAELVNSQAIVPSLTDLPPCALCPADGERPMFRERFIVVTSQSAVVRRQQAERGNRCKTAAVSTALVNPATGEAIAEVPRFGAAQVDQVVNDAHDVY